MLCVKLDVVLSVYVTVNVCDAWLSFTPVASILSAVNCPDGRVIVALSTASAAFDGPMLNVVLLHVTDDPNRLAEYALPVPSRPPVLKLVPSV